MGSGKGVPGTDPAKNKAEESQQGPRDAASAPTTRERVRSQDETCACWERDYFYTLVFLRLIPFLFFLTIW